jgi:hypothetical protein
MNDPRAKRAQAAFAGLCFALGLSFSGIASATPFSMTLQINWKSEFSDKTKNSEIGDVENACHQLGLAFGQNSGPFGVGIFKAASCHFNGEQIIEALGSENYPRFQLEIMDTDKHLELTLFYHNQSDQTNIASLSLPQSQASSNLLADRPFALAVAATLLAKLPFQGVLSKKVGGAEKPLIFTNANTEGLPAPPATLKLALPPKEQTSIPENFYYIGGGTLRPASELEIESIEDEFDPLDSPDQIYEISKTAKMMLAKTHLLVVTPTHEYDWSTHLENTLKLRVKAIQPNLGKQLILNFAKSLFNGIFGFRFGQPRGNDAILLPKTLLINIFAESRAGLLENFRFNLDYVNKTKEILHNQEYSLAWRRMTVGYSLGFDFDSFLSRIDFIPKYGQWQLDAELPVRDKKGVHRPENYSFSKKTSIGYELGLEMNVWQLLVRVWNVRDVSTNIFSKEAGGARSERLGIDLVTKVPTLSFGRKRLKTSFLLYAMHEAFLISRQDKSLGSTLNPEGVKDTESADEVFYDLVYFGAGMGLSW